MAAVVVRVLGVAVAVPTHDVETADRLRRQWSRALTRSPAEVTADTTGLSDLAPDQHDYAMTSRVTLCALEATAGTRLNIHAGAVADGEGRALAVVGESGMGKTTAIRALARRLGYLSDETVSVSPDLTVHPHAKPLSVVTDPIPPTRIARRRSRRTTLACSSHRSTRHFGA
jgi:NaMN:DMB phosphoribosyltransferase